MSFSQDVKTELFQKYTKAVHCQKAQLAALQIFDPKNIEKNEERGLFIYNFTIGTKTFNININPHENAELLTEKTCCKRAFLRGAFLGAGTISDPEKEYRFDILCDNRESAEFVQKLLLEFEIQSRITCRRGRFVLYLKEAEAISDALNVMEAHNSMMAFENVRILKEMRGAVNRQVNCETANINKTVSAAMKQAEDIQLILSQSGWEALDENLAETAKARLEHPDVTLAELGDLMSPPVSKSAVNHRMRKIKQIAEAIRDQN